MKPGLIEEQLEQVITCYSDDSYVDSRDKAMVAFYASSGLRFDEVLKLTVNDVLRHDDGQLHHLGRLGGCYLSS
jgi:site-specific recombinase XerD